MKPTPIVSIATRIRTIELTINICSNTIIKSKEKHTMTCPGIIVNAFISIRL